MMSPEPNNSNKEMIISFLTIRKAIGWLGMLLPFVLWTGSILFGGNCDLQPSISHYYFTNMREVFVGVLCAVSLFLFTYKGHSSADGIASNAAALFAVGVALFPTNVIENYPCQHEVISFIGVSFHNIIHFTCATLFFLTLSYMSLFLFTKSKHEKENRTREKRKRNVVYIICGVIMLLSIVIIAASNFIFHVSDTSKVTYCFETVALIAFGFSWLTKGEMLFGDK